MQKNLISEDVLKAIAGFLIILAFVAVIAAFSNNSSGSSNSGGDSSNDSSDSGNDSSDTPQPDSPTEYTLSGTWVFNETVTLEGGEIYDQSVQFNSNNQTFYGMYTEKTATWGYQPSSTGGTQNLTYVYNRDGWIDQAYRTIEFDGVQTVSKEFYDWFTSNAVNQEETTYELSGTWLFNETVLLAVYYEADVTYNIEYSSNSVPYTSMSFVYDYEAEKADRYYLIYGDNVVYGEGKGSVPSGWPDEAYRTITFDGTQTVSKEFYEWFTANAFCQVIAGNTTVLHNGHEYPEQSFSITISTSNTDESRFNSVSIDNGLFNVNAFRASSVVYVNNMVAEWLAEGQMLAEQVGGSCAQVSAGPNVYFENITIDILDSSASNVNITATVYNPILNVRETRVATLENGWYVAKFTDIIDTTGVEITYPDGSKVPYMPDNMYWQLKWKVSSNLITFYIDLDDNPENIPKSEVFTAEEGMTWAEWLSSEYNTDNFTTFTTTEGSYINCGRVDSKWKAVVYDGKSVLTSDTIFGGFAYATELRSFTYSGGEA